MADLKQYRAKWTISGLGKKDVKPGEVVKLADEDAAPLVECGALVPVGTQPEQAAE